MQHELHKNGPFVVGFNTNGWVYHYESGVLLDMDSRETDRNEEKTEFVIYHYARRVSYFSLLAGKPMATNNSRSCDCRIWRI